jgi:pyruvate formate lyase activating enzyme
MNDSDEDISRLVDFIATLSDDIPLHFSAYHPMYKMNVNATTADTMLRALGMARKKLKHVFAGNIALDDGSNSVCAECGVVLIERDGYRTRVVGLNGTRCAGCNSETGIVR